MPLSTRTFIWISKTTASTKIDACHCKGDRKGKGNRWRGAKIIKFGSIDLAQLHIKGDP